MGAVQFVKRNCVAPNKDTDLVRYANMGINIEDQNAEHYYINPRNVVYVKQRDKFWKILLVGGEVVITKNAAGAKAIIKAIQ